MNEKIENIIREEIEKQGLLYYDIEYQKEGPDWFLRVIVDKDVEGGVQLEDLVTLNQTLCEVITDDMLDRECIFEVCSPGAERRLRNLEEIAAYIGSYVYVKTYEKIDGVKEFYGDLVSVEGEDVTLKINKKSIKIAYGKMSNIRLAIKF